MQQPRCRFVFSCGMRFVPISQDDRVYFAMPRAIILTAEEADRGDGIFKLWVRMFVRVCVTLLLKHLQVHRSCVSPRNGVLSEI